MDIPKYALDENGKAYKLPDPPREPVCTVTPAMLLDMKKAMEEEDGSFKMAIKIVMTGLPAHYNFQSGPRPDKQLKIRMHYHYVTIGVPIGDPYLLQRSLALAACDVLHYQGHDPFSILFPDIDCRIISANFKTALVREPTQKP